MWIKRPFDLGFLDCYFIYLFFHLAPQQNFFFCFIIKGWISNKYPMCPLHFVLAFPSPEKIAFSPNNSKISPAYIVFISAAVVLPAMVNLCGDRNNSLCPCCALQFIFIFSPQVWLRITLSWVSSWDSIPTHLLFLYRKNKQSSMRTLWRSWGQSQIILQWATMDKAILHSSGFVFVTFYLQTFLVLI